MFGNLVGRGVERGDVSERNGQTENPIQGKSTEVGAKRVTETLFLKLILRPPRSECGVGDVEGTGHGSLTRSPGTKEDRVPVIECHSRGRRPTSVETEKEKQTHNYRVFLL